MNWIRWQTKKGWLYLGKIMGWAYPVPSYGETVFIEIAKQAATRGALDSYLSGLNIRTREDVLTFVHGKAYLEKNPIKNKIRWV